jgi:hypothetical protein
LREAAARLEACAQAQHLEHTQEAIVGLTHCLAPLTLALQAYLEGRPSVDDATPAKRLAPHPSLGSATLTPRPGAVSTADTISDA